MKKRPQSGVAAVLSGRYEYTQNGRTLVSDSSNLLLLPQGGEYDFMCIEPGECLLVNFIAEDGPELVETVPVSDGGRYEALMRRITDNGGTASRMRNLSILYEIFAMLAAEEENHRQLPTSFDISRSVEFMKENFSDPTLSLPRIAAKSSISAVYFRKLFTDAYGMPPIRWLQELRMSHAKKLLAEHGHSIADIAAACGYSDIYSFSNAFRKAVGMPPTAYVKNLLQF